MQKLAIKEQLYGGITEMMKNDKLFHRSEIGGKHEYSRWSQDGQQELLEFVLDISRRMLIVEDLETDKRAKDLVINNLKAK